MIAFSQCRLSVMTVGVSDNTCLRPGLDTASEAHRSSTFSDFAKIHRNVEIRSVLIHIVKT